MATRLISAGIGVAVALLVFFLHHTIVLPIAAALIALIILFEFFRANDLFKYRITAVASLIYAAALPFVTVGIAARFRMLLTVVCIGLLLADYVLQAQKMPAKDFFAAAAGTLLTANGMACAITLHNTHSQHGLAYLVLALGGAWLADTGAYFTGTFFGKTKLCPKVSPKKTLEGFIGGIVTNIIFFVVFNLVYQAVLANKGTPIEVSWLSTVCVAAVCAVLGTVGDLAASVLKRQLDIKDYGTIMPGHGGLLDRFDSVLLVLPFFCAYVQASSFFNIV